MERHQIAAKLLGLPQIRCKELTANHSNVAAQEEEDSIV